MGLESTFILAMLVSTTFLLPLALPVTALVLLGLNLEIGVIGLMVRLSTLIGSAALGAFVLRRIIGHRNTQLINHNLFSPSCLALGKRLAKTNHNIQPMRQCLTRFCRYHRTCLAMICSTFRMP